MIRDRHEIGRLFRQQATGLAVTFLPKSYAYEGVDLASEDSVTVLAAFELERKMKATIEAKCRALLVIERPSKPRKYVGNSRQRRKERRADQRWERIVAANWPAYKRPFER